MRARGALHAGSFLGGIYDKTSDQPAIISYGRELSGLSPPRLRSVGPEVVGPPSGTPHSPVGLSVDGIDKPDATHLQHVKPWNTGPGTLTYSPQVHPWPPSTKTAHFRSFAVPPWRAAWAGQSPAPPGPFAKQVVHK